MSTLKSLCLSLMRVIIYIVANKLYELSRYVNVCIIYSKVNCWLIDNKTVSTKFSYLFLTIGYFTQWSRVFPESSIVAQLANKYNFMVTGLITIFTTVRPRSLYWGVLIFFFLINMHWTATKLPTAPNRTRYNIQYILNCIRLIPIKHRLL
jgi:hypothetical protein